MQFKKLIILLIILFLPVGIDALSVSPVLIKPEDKKSIRLINDSQNTLNLKIVVESSAGEEINSLIFEDENVIINPSQEITVSFENPNGVEAYIRFLQSDSNVTVSPRIKVIGDNYNFNPQVNIGVANNSILIGDEVNIPIEIINDSTAYFRATIQLVKNEQIIYRDVLDYSANGSRNENILLSFQPEELLTNYEVEVLLNDTITGQTEFKEVKINNVKTIFIPALLLPVIIIGILFRITFLKK